MSLLLSQQGWAASAALAEGADTLLAQVAPVVAASVSVTDGADVLQAQAGPVPAFTSASTDGADVLAASVSVLSSIDFSAALLDGADVLAAAVEVPSKIGGDDAPRVEIWTRRTAKAARQRATRKLRVLEAVAPEVAVPLPVAREQPDWRAYVAELQAAIAQIEAAYAWLETDYDDEEILLLLA